MSGLFPSTPAAKDIKISSNQPSRVSETHSQKIQVRASGSQRFSIKVDFPPMTRAEFAPINAFVESQAGRFGRFSYIAPIESYTRGNATTVIKVKGDQNKGDNGIELTGVDSPLLPGDYISFFNHSKVYTVSRSGMEFIELTTPLFENVPNGEVVIYNAVPFRVAKAKDLSEYSLNFNRHYSFSIDLVEVF